MLIMSFDSNSIFSSHKNDQKVTSHEFKIYVQTSDDYMLQEKFTFLPTRDLEKWQLPPVIQENDTFFHVSKFNYYISKENYLMNNTQYKIV